MEAVTAAFAEAKRAQEPAGGERAMDAAEAHRRHINERFYDLPCALHRGLGDICVADERFARNYDDREPVLAVYVLDAIHATADRPSRRRFPLGHRRQCRPERPRTSKPGRGVR